MESCGKLYQPGNTGEKQQKMMVGAYRASYIYIITCKTNVQEGTNY